MNPRRYIATALFALALLSQALLPLLHAQMFARQSGSGLAFAFCGQASPALLAQARSIMPAQIASALAQPSASTPADCPLCLVVHALGGMMLAVAIALFLMLWQGRTHRCAARAGTPHLAAPRRYLSRAPPALSVC